MTPILERYLDLLLRWNARINLTSLHDRDAIIEKHFEDSLAVLPHIPGSARTLVDVGSGGGFPGAVIAASRPDLLVTLVESNHKKAAFLQTLRRELPLENTTVLAERIEDVMRKPGWNPWDVAVSRATWAVPEWFALATTMVPRGGTVLAMEGAEQHELPAATTRHEYELGDARRAILVRST